MTALCLEVAIEHGATVHERQQARDRELSARARHECAQMNLRLIREEVAQEGEKERAEGKACRSCILSWAGAMLCSRHSRMADRLREAERRALAAQRAWADAAHAARKVEG